MNKKFTAVLLLCALLLCACGTSSGDDSAAVTTASASGQGSETTAVVETAAEYVRPEKDFGGKTLTVLNMNAYYGANVRVDIAEQTGETLDDAMYERNRSIEEELNFKLNEAMVGNDWQGGTQLIDAFSKSVLAGDDTYQAAYLPLYFGPH